jgi:hypothetical protein
MRLYKAGCGQKQIKPVLRFKTLRHFKIITGTMHFPKQEQSIEYCGWACCATRHNTPIHNILSTAPQLNISQMALGMLPEDGNVMPKLVGTTIHN